MARHVHRLLQLPAGVVARPEVPHLPGPHQTVECGQRLLQGGRLVEGVYLIEVDVVGTEPAQARVHRGEDVLAPRTVIVRAGAGWPEQLGGNDEIVPGPLR
jgi:hypothetical protein